MKRYLAIWLPSWPIQRRRHDRPELFGRAIVLQTASRRGPCVAVCSREAMEAGVEAGMPVAEALAIAKARRQGRTAEQRAALAEVDTHDPAADRRGLAELAQWCHRFSPTVGLEEAEQPETILLDITNLSSLYGGEGRLIEQVRRGLQQRRYEARVAVGGTIGAAWALAHYDPDGEGHMERRLGALPIGALRLPPETLETFAELGLQEVREILALPAAELRSRLGPLVLLRLDQLRGRTGETFMPVDPPAEFAVQCLLEFPLTRRDAIYKVLEQLFARLEWMLTQRNRGALALECQITCEDAPETALQFNLFQPSASAGRLLEIADLQLERLRLPGRVTAASIRVLQHAPLVERQESLFESEPALGTSRQLTTLVDRLAGRLGSGAVVRCRLRPQAQPELAYRNVSVLDDKSFRRPLKKRRRGGGREAAGAEGAHTAAADAPSFKFRCLDRPLCLLRRPAELQAVSIIPDGPPIRFERFGRRHDVARSWGPERIETGWWRQSGAWRDYYRVETREGLRLWLFRRRRDGKWFLHGLFG